MSLLTLVAKLSTSSLHGYSIQFSPHNNCIAVAAAENFGIQGCGALLIYTKTNLFSNGYQLCKYPTGLYDIAWSEENPDLILTSSTDGYVQFWSLSLLGKPISNLQAHDSEISSINWGHIQNGIFASSSWDSLVKLWNVFNKIPVSVLQSHKLLVYETRWSRPSPNHLASVSGDGTVIWDPLRSPGEPVMKFPSIEGIEILTCDWSNIYGHIMAVGSTDCSVTIWDLRSPSVPMLHMKRHTGPVRKLRFSPVLPYEFVTVSYDFTTKLWDASIPGSLLCSVENHTEFVYGVDYDRQNPKRIADCGWDTVINMYDISRNYTTKEYNGSILGKSHSSLETNLNSQKFGAAMPRMSQFPRPLKIKDDVNFSSRPLPMLPNHIGSKL